MKEPLVSIITPTWKRPQGLARAVDCVNKQEYTNYEHIVLHDGREPNELPTHTKRKVVFLDKNHDDVGVTPINEGRKLAKGDLFMVLSDDNEISPEHIRKLVKLFQEDEGLGFGMSFGEMWDTEQQKRIAVFNSVVPQYQFFDLGQMMIDRQVDKQFGPWVYTRYAYDLDRAQLMAKSGVRHRCNHEFSFKFWNGHVE